MRKSWSGGCGAIRGELAIVNVIEGLLAVHAECEEEDVEEGCCACQSDSGGNG